VADLGDVVTTLMHSRGLCAPCIAYRTGVTASEVRAQIERMAANVKITQSRVRCAGCSLETHVYSLA
jgi:hypothetical protein